MPVIGEFHSQYWRHRANAVIPPGPNAGGWAYPKVQQVASGISMGARMVLFGPPLDWLRVYWYRLLRWLLPATDHALLTLGAQYTGFDAEQQAVLARVTRVLRSPGWAEARRAVRECATTPSFHEPSQWVEYSRAIRSNLGQAQNIHRHLKAVHAVRGLHDGPAALSNPDAHLLVELAYQGMAAQGRAGMDT